MVKKTALGESIDEVMAAEKRELEFHQNMLQYIDSVIAIGTQHNSEWPVSYISALEIILNFSFSCASCVNSS